MLLGQELCRQYKGETPTPPCDLSAEFCFTGKTDEEYSLVCATGYVPANVIRRDDGWKGFRIQGRPLIRKQLHPMIGTLFLKAMIIFNFLVFKNYGTRYLLPSC